MTEDEYVSSLSIVNVASGEVRVLAPSRDDVDAPLWSRDGSHVAFVAPESDDSKVKPQVWILPMDGGEASLLRHAPNGSALALARNYGLTAYDAAYLTCADDLGLELVTADGPLDRAARNFGLTTTFVT